MTITLEVVNCIKCIHYIPKTDTCKAFPDMIPEEIFYGQVKHDKPYKKDGYDDKGIIFEPIKQEGNK